MSELTVRDKLTMAELKDLLHAEEALVLQKIYESTFDIVLIVDSEKNILQASPSIKTIGYSPVDVELKSLYILANDNTVIDKLFDNPSNGHKETFVVPLTNKAREVVNYEVFCKKLDLEKQDLFIVIASDVSAKMLAESELKKHSENIEAELKKERQYRLDESRFSLQKQITQWLVILIAILILIPYVLSLFGNVPNDLTNGLLNVVLMLSGALVGAISGIFSNKTSENNSNSNNNIQVKKE